MGSGGQSVGMLDQREISQGMEAFDAFAIPTPFQSMN